MMAQCTAQRWRMLWSVTSSGVTLVRTQERADRLELMERRRGTATIQLQQEARAATCNEAQHATKAQHDTYCV